VELASTSASGSRRYHALPVAALNTIAKEDPYHYTAGRWLKDDKIQRDARYIDFDFPGLCRRAVKTSDGASKVVEYEKIEGGFNRVFIIRLDNGARVVARIPFSVAGPPRLRTNSEVATMAYGTSTTARN
jgi:hypothetical protein